MKKTILFLLLSFKIYAQSVQVLVKPPHILNKKDVFLSWNLPNDSLNHQHYLEVTNISTKRSIVHIPIDNLESYTLNSLQRGHEYQFSILDFETAVVQPISFKIPANTLQINSSQTVQNLYISNNAGLYLSNPIICTNSNMTLNASVFPANNTNLSYQWNKDGVDLVGEINSSLMTIGVGAYVVKVFQNGSTFTSNTTQLTYANSGLFTSTIRNEPGIQCAGNTITILSIYDSNTATFQWTKDEINIVGATNKSYDATQSGRYRLNIQDGSCIFNTNYGSDKVHLENSLFPTIYNIDSLYCPSGIGARIQFGSHYTTNYFNFQWLKNGEIIPDATNFDYFAFDEGIYSLKISQNTCSSISRGIKIKKITEYPKKVNISNHTDLCLANSIRLGFENEFRNYQWYKDGSPIIGMNSKDLTVAQVGNYKCEISSLGQCATFSDEIIVTNGTNLNPKIEFNSSKRDCFALYLQYKNYNLENLTNLTFQWYLNGDLIIGATSFSYYATQTGNYQLKVKNTLTNCEGFSNTLFAEITLTNPELSIEEYKGPVCKNSFAWINLNKWRFFNSTQYQWKKNGISIPNEVYSDLYVKESGNYSIVFTTGSCVAESTPVAIRVDSIPDAALSGLASIFYNQSVQIPLTLTGGGDYFVKLNDNSKYFINQNAVNINKTPSQNINYSISNFGNHCGVGNPIGDFQVNVLSCPPTNIINNKINSNLTFSANQTIIGNSTIRSTANARFSAKNNVVLNPPFNTESGAVFQADTDGCEN